MAKNRRPAPPAVRPDGLTDWHLALKPGAPVQRQLDGDRVLNCKTTTTPFEHSPGVWAIGVTGKVPVVNLSTIRPFKKPSKYRNVRTEYPAGSGEWYDSKAEAARAAALAEGKASGQYRLVLRQPTFRLGVVENVYRPDFLVVDHVGDCWAEDVKGKPTPKFNRDKKLWARYGDVPLRVITNGKVVETIVPQGRGI